MSFASSAINTANPLFQQLDLSEKTRLIQAMLEMLNAYTSGGRFVTLSNALINLVLQVEQFENTSDIASLQSNLSLEKIIVLYHIRNTIGEPARSALNYYISLHDGFDAQAPKQSLKIEGDHEYVKMMINCALRDWAKLESNNIRVFSTRWLAEAAAQNELSLSNTHSNSNSNQAFPIVNKLSGIWKKEAPRAIASEQTNAFVWKASVEQDMAFTESWLGQNEFQQALKAIYPQVIDVQNGKTEVWLTDFFLQVAREKETHTQEIINHPLIAPFKTLFYSMWDRQDLSQRLMNRAQ
jgi:hypothetical protein